MFILCRYYNGAAAVDCKDGGGFRNGGVSNGNGYVSRVMGRLPPSVAARINLAMLKGRSIPAADKLSAARKKWSTVV